MTVNEFFRCFLQDNAEFGFDIFSNLVGRKEIELEPWHSDEQGKPIRLLKTIIPVKGVPFLSSTRHRKNFKLTHKDDTKIILEMDNR